MSFSLSQAFVIPWTLEPHSRSALHVQHSEERARHYGLLTNSADDVRSFHAFVQLDAFVYPYTSLARLGVVGGFNQWLYFLDDQYDDHPERHGDLDSIRALMERSLNLWHGGALPNAATPLDHYTRALRQEFDALMPADFLPRFVKNIEKYLLCGSLVGLGHWLRGETLDLDEYIELRSLDSGVYPVVDCIELAANLRLTRLMRQLPLIQKMADCTVRHVALANDIFSFEKETLLRGSTMNLVHVINERDKAGVEAAATHATQIVNGFASEFLELERQLNRQPLGRSEEVRAYVTGMKSWMRGNVEFSLQSHRFRSETSPFMELRASGRIPSA